jgi:hypothetical protein
MSVMDLASAWPVTSRTIQRLSDGTTSQAGAQHKIVDQSILRHRVALDHLGARLQGLVPREQRVVDHLRMHDRDGCRVGVRIEHFEIGMRTDAQHVVGGRPARRQRRDPEQQGQRQHPMDHDVLLSAAAPASQELDQAGIPGGD